MSYQVSPSLINHILNYHAQNIYVHLQQEKMYSAALCDCSYFLPIYLSCTPASPNERGCYVPLKIARKYNLTCLSFEVSSPFQKKIETQK